MTDKCMKRKAKIPNCTLLTLRHQGRLDYDTNIVDKANDHVSLSLVIWNLLSIKATLMHIMHIHIHTV